jgi:hypothetical protein
MEQPILFSCKKKVDPLPSRIRTEGHIVVGQPRTNYECIVEYNQGNWIEITILVFQILLVKNKIYGNQKYNI